MKTVYFVRHGETDGNKLKQYQHIETPLSEVGLAQAAVVAKRFLDIDAEVIIASDMKRAAQTAQAISLETKIPLEYNSVLQEILQPSEIRGRAHADPEVIAIRTITAQKWPLPNEHYSDEENFTDVQARSLRALEMIEKRPEDKLIVVTHGAFLRTLIGNIVLNKRLTPELGRAFEDNIIASNTALTWCEYTGDTWRLITWNDHAHLGDEYL